MRFIRSMAITVLLLACVVLGSACAGAKGEEGPQGAKGDTGAAGVGVQNIVNNGNGTFIVNLTNGTAYTTDNFTGPKGEQGQQGTQGIQGNPSMPGVGVEWVGEWDSSVLYGKYDGVGHQGSSYISKQPNNTNHLPTDENWWDLWVEKGDTGATGAAGADGEDGAPGPNMIVAMGVVDQDGTLLEGYNVTGATWDSSGGRYLVQLTGIDFDYTASRHYVVQVTPWAVHLPPTYFHGSGSLVVSFYNTDTHQNTSAAFSFMVLECPS